jgi:hypothetical protein
VEFPTSLEVAVSWGREDHSIENRNPLADMPRRADFQQEKNILLKFAKGQSGDSACLARNGERSVAASKERISQPLAFTI